MASCWRVTVHADSLVQRRPLQSCHILALFVHRNHSLVLCEGTARPGRAGRYTTGSLSVSQHKVSGKTKTAKGLFTCREEGQRERGSGSVRVVVRNSASTASSLGFRWYKYNEVSFRGIHLAVYRQRTTAFINEVISVAFPSALIRSIGLK